MNAIKEDPIAEILKKIALTPKGEKREKLLQDENRIIDVEWYNEKAEGAYNVEIEILSNDRTGLLSDIVKEINVVVEAFESRSIQEGIKIITDIIVTIIKIILHNLNSLIL